MSKAEDRALEVYPKIIKRYRKLGDTKENTGSEYDENLEQRAIYIKGYHQAEKDLELTWEDIREIYDLAYNLRFPHKKQKEFFEEVLKRFKAMNYE